VRDPYYQVVQTQSQIENAEENERYLAELQVVSQTEYIRLVW
jgi:hypothetical protein